MTESELIYYRGNCHCSAVVYELRLPKISTVDQCNCSICLKKGYLLVHAGAEAEFKILKGEDALTEYRFHAKRVSHQVRLRQARVICYLYAANTLQFCSTCGTPLFRFGAASGTPLGKNLALNVRTGLLANVTALTSPTTGSRSSRDRHLEARNKPVCCVSCSCKLKYNSNPRRIDGASLGEEYRPPAHKGSLPAATFSGSTTFTGSCHCGALTVAVTSKPLENNPDVRLVECNCSICERVRPF